MSTYRAYLINKLKDNSLFQNQFDSVYIEERDQFGRAAYRFVGKVPQLTTDELEDAVSKNGHIK